MLFQGEPVAESPHSCGTNFIQNRLKPFKSPARIRNFSAGSSNREVGARVMESPTGLQSMRQATMTKAVDTQPEYAPLPQPATESATNQYATEHGPVVRLDVVDLAAPDDDY